MDWMPFASSALGAIGDLFSASSAQDAQMEMMRQQMEFNREVMQNRHQWEVEDLKAAGLNPLMSVTSPTGTLSAPTPASVAKANLSQSALALGQLNIQDKFANAAQTSAEADMIRANNDTNRTNFYMGPDFELKTGVEASKIDNLIASTNLIHSQEALNILQQEWLPKLYKMQLSKDQMIIATGYLVSEAQNYALRTNADANMLSSRAAMVSANASVINAQANLSHADSYDRFVGNAVYLGMNTATLQSHESDVAIEEAKKIVEQTKGLARENRYGEFNEASDYYRFTRHVGDTGRNLTSLTGFGNLVR